MSRRTLFPATLAVVGVALTFALLAVVLSLAGADERPEAPSAAPATTVASGPSEEEVAAFYEALATEAFYEALATTTTTTPPPPATVPQVAVPEPVAGTSPVVDYEAGSLEEMICGVFGDQCAKALAVVHCESRFNPGTVGAAGERGLFQIHPVHIPYLAEQGLSWDAMFDPAANIAYAYDLYSRSGWGPWTCA